ncbi:MAG: SEC-C metal-binding domain-containing protein, partial [Patescibacteria group bacterium]
IENKMISRSIEGAQKKVEGHNFDIRKHLVEYDDVINKHREVIYGRRRDVVKSLEKPEGRRAAMLEALHEEIERIISTLTSAEREDEWNVDEIYESADAIFPIPLQARLKLEHFRKSATDVGSTVAARNEILTHIQELLSNGYAELEQRVRETPAGRQATANGQDLMRLVERAVELRVIDNLWIEHLALMDHLRQGIGLRGYGQRDPLVEYKKEAYILFSQLLSAIRSQVVHAIFKANISVPASTQQPKQALTFSAPAKESTDVTSPTATTSVTTNQEPGEKIGRNDTCPCGSGKKFKKCGLLNTAEHQQFMAKTSA